MNTEQTPTPVPHIRKRLPLKREIELVILSIVLMGVAFTATTLWIVPGIKIWQFAIIDIMGSISIGFIRYMRKKS